MPVWNTDRNNDAKDALRAELDGGRWVAHADAINAMGRASGLAPRTCANVLRELVKDWSLKQRGSYKAGGRYASDTREYRATGPESISRTRDMVADMDQHLKRARNKLAHQNALLQATLGKIAELKQSIDDMEAMREVMTDPENQ